jgi:hypothetical protein
VIPNAAPKYEQAGVLACVERVRRAGSRSKEAESVGLIVIGRTIAVERASTRTDIWGRPRQHGLVEPSFSRAAV